MAHPEEWRPVAGYEGWYVVSTLGRVRRVRGGPGVRVGHYLRPTSNAGGYAVVNLTRDGNSSTRYVHRLVAEAFLGPCPAGREVNHRDGDKSNACLDNLEYITHAENGAHAARSGLSARGRQMPHTKLTDQAVREIRALRGVVPQHELARRYGVSEGHLSQILSGQKRSHVEAVSA